MSSRLTQERLKQVLNYDPEAGIFTRFLKGFGAGGLLSKPVGRADSAGYTKISIDGHVYRGHRLAWLYQTGEWPEGEIDHVNGVKSDNRFVNLRRCSKAQNQQNRAPAKASTSRHVGVSWCKAHRKWRAQIKFDNTVRGLGFFTTEEAALGAYLAAKAQIHTFNPIPRPA